MIRNLEHRKSYCVKPSDIKVGEMFRIKSLDWFNENAIHDAENDGKLVECKRYQFDFNENMSRYCGQVFEVTDISKVCRSWITKYQDPTAFHLGLPREIDALSYWFTPEMVEFP